VQAVISNRYSVIGCPLAKSKGQYLVVIVLVVMVMLVIAVWLS